MKLFAIMFYLIALLTVILLSLRDDTKLKMECIDSVEYIKISRNSKGYMAPHFKPDGSLYTCKENTIVVKK